MCLFKAFGSMSFFNCFPSGHYSHKWTSPKIKIKCSWKLFSLPPFVIIVFCNSHLFQGCVFFLDNICLFNQSLTLFDDYFLCLFCVSTNQPRFIKCLHLGQFIKSWKLSIRLYVQIPKLESVHTLSPQLC